MHLIVGLGNPGPGYANNRHNVGFKIIDAVVERYCLGPYRVRFHGLAARGDVEGTRVLALRPSTYMNRSGEAVAAAARYHRIPVERIVVVHDELDLRPGKVRVKRGGGAAGHNGLRNIDAHLGPEYWRVRVGIGHPGDPAGAQSYVLRDFAKAERSWLDRVVEAVARYLPLLLDGRDSDFMSRIATEATPPKEVRREAKAQPPPCPPGDGI